jgi:hypothetical protein
MLKVGLLGAGRIAGVHATAISSHPGSTLVAVSDINADAAAKLAAQYGAEARTTDAILADPAIDAVLIATSTDTHSDLIERATGAGKAVLCEKPVDLSLARAQACLKVAPEEWQAGDDRLQPPLRPELCRAEGGAGPRRDRQARDCCRSPRSIPLRRRSPTSRSRVACSAT